MIAGAGCKLAFSIATNMTVLCMLYGAMMGNYDGLYLPMMIVGYIFSVPFFLLTVRTSQKHGRKRHWFDIQESHWQCMLEFWYFSCCGNRGIRHGT